MEDKILEQNEATQEVRFCGTQLRPDYASFKRAKAVILPCPYDVTTSYIKGTQNGPMAIIKASDHMELFDDEMKGETYRIGIHTKQPLALETLSPEDMVEKIKHEAAEVLEAGKMPVIIGGEHSVDRLDDGKFRLRKLGGGVLQHNCGARGVRIMLGKPTLW